jgi:hypothetical protein
MNHGMINKDGDHNRGIGGDGTMKKNTFGVSAKGGKKDVKVES